MVGFCRALLFFGERIWAGAGFRREVARVVLAAGALLAATGAGFWGAVRTRFLVTSSAFSLSSLDSSSLDRFLPRVVVCLGAGLAGAGLVAAALLAGAARVLRAVVAGGGGCFLMVVLAGAAGLAGAGFEAAVVVAGARSSERGSCRLVAGTRLTRLSRRDRRLAHCASHIARNFSFRALTTK